MSSIYIHPPNPPIILVPPWTTAAGASCTTSLSFRGNRLSPDAASDLFAKLSSHPTLASLDLSRCGLGVAHIKALAAALLSDNGTLAELVLRGNALGPGTVGTLAVALSAGGARALASLNLEVCNVTPEACERLAAAVEASPALREVAVGGNPCEGTPEGERLAAAAARNAARPARAAREAALADLLEGLAAERVAYCYSLSAADVRLSGEDVRRLADAIAVNGSLLEIK